jgi:4-amino-4-deoxy-L-arabinose transferase-like glycosyltransferase
MTPRVPVPRTFGATVGLTALGALALRVVYALAVAGKAPLTGDGLENYGIALGVVHGRGYVAPLVFDEAVPTAHKPPLYPLFLALVSAVGPDSYVAHQIASAVIGTATVVVVALLGRRVAGPRAGLLAGGLAAVYPILLITDASLRSESLYALLVALALLAAYRAVDRASAGRVAVLGAVVGLAALTRTEGLALLVLLALPVAWRTGRAGRGQRIGLVAAACAVVLVPWLVRCWSVFDRPVLISTNSGDLIAGANCSRTYRGDYLGAWLFQCLPDVRGGNEAQRADRLRDVGLHFARHHAGRLPVVLAARVLRSWSLFRPEQQLGIDATEGRSRTAGELGRFACYGLMILAAVGTLHLRRRREPLLILVAPVVLVVVVSITAYGVTRFRIPADIVLIVLAAVALDALLRTPTGRASARSRRSGVRGDRPPPWRRVRAAPPG